MHELQMILAFFERNRAAWGNCMRDMCESGEGKGRWLTLLYTPASMALNRVDFPWKPPPTTSVTPRRRPIPVTAPPLCSCTVTSIEGGEAKGMASPACMGASDAPLRLWIEITASDELQAVHSLRFIPRDQGLEWGFTNDGIASCRIFQGDTQWAPSCPAAQHPQVRGLQGSAVWSHISVQCMALIKVLGLY